MKQINQFYLVSFLVITILFSSNLPLSGQINVEPGPGITPEQMVENIVGEGIQYDNVTFQGANISRGIFSNGQTTNLGISSGIFLTSGAGYNIPGPNVATGSTGANGMPGHPSLNAITTSPTYDAAVLEFDFIPESDTLRFKYVFGSEEYNEYVNSSFNDVFGYFVTGPDPMGGMYSDENIALIPGTSTSVKINSVNNGWAPGGVVPTGPCTNCAYFSDNTGGLTLEYDAFTTVLVAFLQVVPCETYHIKIGVADAGDGILDSGVFLEENSFESPKIEV
ncbi:MAG: choice-of-anchor L domain-containing protein, partial [Bacteroidetes bacterium]|nr:choice-of-anchor L domain-containing protein [Bacteroidota bacterium]